jgi:hypothetical protein
MMKNMLDMMLGGLAAGAMISAIFFLIGITVMVLLKIAQRFFP